MHKTKLKDILESTFQNFVQFNIVIVLLRS